MAEKQSTIDVEAGSPSQPSTPLSAAAESHLVRSESETLAGPEVQVVKETKLPPYDNPRAWSTFKKSRVTFVAATTLLSLIYSSSAYTSSAEAMVEHFHVSEEVILLGVTLFLVGFAVGPLLWGPAAQVFGHRPVYIATFICFTGFSFGASEAPNAGALLAFRFLASTFGASSLSSAAGVINDLVVPTSAFLYLVWYGLAAFAGPGLGPLLGGFIDTEAGFRWNMRVQALFAGVMTLFVIFFLPETNHLILQERANAAAAHSHTTLRQKLKKVRKALRATISQPFVILFTEPVVLAVTVYLSLLYSILYLSFIVVPMVFVGIRHFSAESNALLFISHLIGFGLGGAAVTWQQQTTTNRLLRSAPGQRISPEVRLLPAIWASVFPPVGLFIFAWTAPFVHVHWIAPCIGLVVLMLGTFGIFTSIVPYLIEYGGLRAPLVIAGSTVMRSLVGAAFPLFGRQMFDKMTVQGGTSMLASCTLLMMPLPYVLHRYGARLRGNH